MNVPRPIFPILAASAVALAGCVGNPFNDAKIDPNSAVAPEVARMTRQATDWPSFSDIPAAPKDLRPPKMYGQQAEELKRAAADLERETAPNTWTLQNTEAFAAAARARTPDLPPVDTADAEAFARELRERATPPPRR